MSIENSIGMPNSSYGLELFPFLANQNVQQFRDYGQGWEMNSLMNTMTPSTSRIYQPSVVAEGSSSFANRVIEVDKVESNNEVINEQSNFQSWYSEFEEMKNAEKKKVT